MECFSFEGELRLHGCMCIELFKCYLKIIYSTKELNTGVKGQEYVQCEVNPYSHVFKLK